MLNMLHMLWCWLWSNHIPEAVGGAFAIWQFWRNSRSNKLNNELSGSPEFYFIKPYECHIFNNSNCSGGDFTPQLSIGCDGGKRVYWFGLANMGRFAARKVRVVIARKNELNNILDIPEDRWLKLDYWGGNNFQDINNSEIIPLTTQLNALELTDGDTNLYVLLEYQSDYTGITYKRQFEWCIVKDGLIRESFSLINGMPYSQIRKAAKELEEKGEVSQKTACELTNDVLSSYQDLTSIFDELNFKRPVFLREVRTVKMTASNKVHFYTKWKVKLHRVISKRLSAQEWLSNF